MILNRNQIVILWVFGNAAIHVLGITSGWLYIALIGPVIIWHARYAYSLETFSESEMKHEKSGYEPESEEVMVTVDEEYTEEIDLKIGGYAKLDCWKEYETPHDEVDGEDIDSYMSYQKKVMREL